jgi:hypothetical protein
MEVERNVLQIQFSIALFAAQGRISDFLCKASKSSTHQQTQSSTPQLTRQHNHQHIKASNSSTHQGMELINTSTDTIIITVIKASKSSTHQQTQSSSQCHQGIKLINTGTNTIIITSAYLSTLVNTSRHRTPHHIYKHNHQHIKASISSTHLQTQSSTYQGIELINLHIYKHNHQHIIDLINTSRRRTRQHINGHNHQHIRASNSSTHQGIELMTHQRAQSSALNSSAHQQTQSSTQ